MLNGINTKDLLIFLQPSFRCVFGIWFPYTIDEEKPFYLSRTVTFLEFQTIHWMFCKQVQLIDI